MPSGAVLWEKLLPGEEVDKVPTKMKAQANTLLEPHKVARWEFTTLQTTKWLGLQIHSFQIIIMETCLSSFCLIFSITLHVGLF